MQRPSSARPSSRSSKSISSRLSRLSRLTRPRIIVEDPDSPEKQRYFRPTLETIPGSFDLRPSDQHVVDPVFPSDRASALGTRSSRTAEVSPSLSQPVPRGTQLGGRPGGSEIQNPASNSIRESTKPVAATPSGLSSRSTSARISRKSAAPTTKPADSKKSRQQSEAAGLKTGLSFGFDSPPASNQTGGSRGTMQVSGGASSTSNTWNSREASGSEGIQLSREQYGSRDTRVSKMPPTISTPRRTEEQAPPDPASDGSKLCTNASDLKEEMLPMFKFYRSTFSENSVSGVITGIEVSFRPCQQKVDPSEGGQEDLKDTEEDWKVKDIMAIGGFLGTTIAYRFSTENANWEKHSELPDARLHFGAVYLNKHLYVVGGCDPADGTQATEDTYRYGPRTKRWDTVTSLNTARAFQAMRCLDGRIYAIGGQGESGRPLNTAEAYDPESDWWTLIGSLLCGRVGASCADYEGRVVVVGGYGEAAGDGEPTPVLDSMEWFDPASNKWELKGQLRVPRAQAGLAKVNDELYLCGGITRDPSTGVLRSVPYVDVYVAAAEQWTQVTCMETARHNAGAAVIDSKLYVVGGACTYTNQILSSVECCDVDSMNWEQVADLPCPAKSLACFVIPAKSVQVVDEVIDIVF